jgi:hypothetical protein
MLENENHEYPRRFSQRKRDNGVSIRTVVDDELRRSVKSIWGHFTPTRWFAQSAKGTHPGAGRGSYAIRWVETSARNGGRQLRNYRRCRSLKACLWQAAPWARVSVVPSDSARNCVGGVVLRSYGRRTVLSRCLQTRRDEGGYGGNTENEQPSGGHACATAGAEHSPEPARTSGSERSGSVEPDIRVGFACGWCSVRAARRRSWRIRKGSLAAVDGRPRKGGREGANHVGAFGGADGSIREAPGRSQDRGKRSEESGFVDLAGDAGIAALFLVVFSNPWMQ